MGQDVLKTTGKTARIELSADQNTICSDGFDLCFVTLRALDENGEPVFTENSEISLAVQGDGELLAFGSADPKPDRLKPFKETTCPLYQGRALAVIRSVEGAKGCLLNASLGDGISTSLGIGFTSPETQPDVAISEIKPGVLDVPIGELLSNEKTSAVLGKQLPELIDNPMLNQMKGLSLRKLASMGGAGFFSADKMKVLEKELSN